MDSRRAGDAVQSVRRRPSPLWRPVRACLEVHLKRLFVAVLLCLASSLALAAVNLNTAAESASATDTPATTAK
jgi:hypothetical protein